MNNEVIKTVQELTNKYGNTIYTDSRKLKSFLSDYYSDKYTREKRLLVDSVEQKIPEEIVNCNGTQIDDFLYNKLAGKLFDNLGISKDLAEETIDAWCEILNKTHIKVNNQSSSNLNNNNYGQTRPGTAANYSQQNYSSNTVIMSTPPASNNNNYGQLRPGSAANYSQQNYSSNTVFMNNQQVNNVPVKSNKMKKSIIGMMLSILIIVVVSTAAYSLGSSKVTTDKNLTNAARESKETNNNQNNVDTKNNTTNNTNTKEKNAQTKLNNFIFPDSSTSKISPSNLYSLSSDQLFIARNEIFARHGYIFNNKKLQNYFEAQAWYKPNPSAKGEPSNDIEDYNAQTIMDMEEIKLAFKNSPIVNREYVLNNSHITKLTSDEVERLSDFEILLARNEIFARHGYIFGVPELNDYFQSKRWYNKISNDVTLSEVEEYNIELIRKVEDKRIYNMLSNYELGS